MIKRRCRMQEWSTIVSEGEKPKRAWVYDIGRQRAGTGLQDVGLWQWQMT